MKIDRSVSVVTQKDEPLSRRSRRHVKKNVDAGRAQIENNLVTLNTWFEEFLSSKHYTRLPTRVQRLIPKAVNSTQDRLFAPEGRPLSDLRPFEVESFFFPGTPRDIAPDQRADFEEAAFDWLLWLCQSSKLTYAKSIQKTLRYIKRSPSPDRTPVTA